MESHRQKPKTFDLTSPIVTGDTRQLERIIDLAVRDSVAADDAEATFIFDDALKSLHTWLESGAVGFSAKIVVGEQLAGFVLVKQFWNLSHLFVNPKHQRQGVGQTLLNAAINACRERSPRNKLQLNSSQVATSFYTAQGFEQTGSAHDRPTRRMYTVRI